MPETVGEAFVAIRADESKLGPDIKRALASATSGSEATTAGKKIGDDVGKGVQSGVSTGVKAAGGLLATLGAVRVLGDINAEARESQKVGAQTEAVLKSTAGAANIQKDAVEALATSLSKKAGIDDEVIQSGENMLLTFRDIRNEAGKGNDIFNQATQASLDLAAGMAAASGGEIDLRSATIQVGKALNDPIAGLTALRRVGVSFTDQQKEQITTLVESGDKLRAQKIILHELTQEFGGSAAAQATAADKGAVAIKNLEESIGVLLLPVLDKGAEALTTIADGFTSLPGPVQTAATYLVLAGGAAVFASKGLDVASKAKARFSAVSFASTAAKEASTAASLGRNLATLGEVAAAAVGSYLITTALLHEAFKDDTGEAFAKGLGNLDKQTRQLAASTDDNLLPAFNRLVSKSIEMKNELNHVAEVTGRDLSVAVGSRAVEAMGRFKDIAEQNVNVAARLLDQIPHESAQYKQLAGILYGVISAKHDVAAATDDLNASTEGQNRLNGQAYGSLTAFARGAGSATTALSDLSAAQKEENDRLALYKQLLEGTQAVQGDVTAAQISLGDATDRVVQSLIENGTNFDINTEAGRNNVGALLDQVRAADQLAEATYKQTGSQDAANKVLDDFKGHLEETLYGLGLNTAQVEDLERQLGLIKSPPPVVIDVQIPGVGQILALEQFLESIGGQNVGIGLGVPAFGAAAGAYVPAHAGGTLLTIGEGGSDEVVVSPADIPGAVRNLRRLGVLDQIMAATGAPGSSPPSGMGQNTYNLYWSAPKPDPITLQRDIESKQRVASHLAGF